MAKRLRKERDELRQIEERLCSERGKARTECDTACQECDAAQQQVSSLEVSSKGRRPRSWMWRMPTPSSRRT
jgi:uncharacterized protein (DUF3084 family)